MVHADQEFHPLKKRWQQSFRTHFCAGNVDFLSRVQCYNHNFNDFFLRFSADFFFLFNIQFQTWPWFLLYIFSWTIILTPVFARKHRRRSYIPMCTQVVSLNLGLLL
jgi:hypothetical protein